MDYLAQDWSSEYRYNLHLKYFSFFYTLLFCYNLVRTINEFTFQDRINTVILFYSLQSDQEEITFIMFQSLHLDDEEHGEGTERKRAELDIAVHVKYDPGQTVIAIHSPYWMVNKTGRLLQYKADDIHRKHPLDYDMPLLFSFKPRNFLRNNKVRRKRF